MTKAVHEVFDESGAKIILKNPTIGDFIGSTLENFYNDKISEHKAVEVSDHESAEDKTPASTKPIKKVSVDTSSLYNMISHYAPFAKRGDPIAQKILIDQYEVLVKLGYTKRNTGRLAYWQKRFEENPKSRAFLAKLARQEKRKQQREAMKAKRLEQKRQKAAAKKAQLQQQTQATATESSPAAITEPVFYGPQNYTYLDAAKAGMEFEATQQAKQLLAKALSVSQLDAVPTVSGLPEDESPVPGRESTSPEDEIADTASPNALTLPSELLSEGALESRGATTTATDHLASCGLIIRPGNSLFHPRAQQQKTRMGTVTKTRRDTIVKSPLYNEGMKGYIHHIFNNIKLNKVSNIQRIMKAAGIECDKSLKCQLSDKAPNIPVIYDDELCDLEVLVMLHQQGLKVIDFAQIEPAEDVYNTLVAMCLSSQAMSSVEQDQPAAVPQDDVDDTNQIRGRGLRSA